VRVPTQSSRAGSGTSKKLPRRKVGTRFLETDRLAISGGVITTRRLGLLSVLQAS